MWLQQPAGQCSGVTICTPFLCAALQVHHLTQYAWVHVVMWSTISVCVSVCLSVCLCALMYACMLLCTCVLLCVIILVLLASSEMSYVYAASAESKHPCTCGFLQGDTCNTCRNAFIRSFLTFEALPLVQFQLAEHITDEQVCPTCPYFSGASQ